MIGEQIIEWRKNVIIWLDRNGGELKDTQRNTVNAAQNLDIFLNIFFSDKCKIIVKKLFIEVNCIVYITV